MNATRAATVAACAAALLAALISAGCASHPPAPPESQTKPLLRIRGSDTMTPLVRRWAEEFMRRYPGEIVDVQAGGSRAGIDALIAGTTDICAASRSFEPAEARRLLERRGSLGICVLCARDALSIFLNTENPVTNLSLEQVRGLLTGRIASWRDVGGGNEPVHVYIREPNSGTRGFLQEQVLGGDEYAHGATTVNGTRALADAVRRDRDGIGFGGIVFGPQVRHCLIDGISPSAAHVRDGSYPIARYLYLYTADQPEGAVKAFIDFVLSPEGQGIVVEVGFVPLWDIP